MGRSYSRPIVGQTGTAVDAYYIPVSRHSSRTNIQVIANGTVTFTVDWTNQSIFYDQATLDGAVNLQPNNESYSDPDTADWSNAIASGSVSANAQLNFPVNAIRIDVTASTGGSVSYRIQQT